MIESLIISFTLVALFAVYAILSERKRKEVFANVTVMGRTTEDETAQFTISLYKNETEHEHVEKVKRVIRIKEHRIKQYNDFMQAIQKQAEEEHKKKKEAILNGKAPSPLTGKPVQVAKS